MSIEDFHSDVDGLTEGELQSQVMVDAGVERKRRHGCGSAQTENHLQIKETFLEYLVAGYSVARAVKCMGSVSRKTLYVWKNDPTQVVYTGENEMSFSDAWDECYKAGTDTLEDIATDQAKAGDSKLMMFLLRARDRKRFGQTAVDLRDARGDITINLSKEDLDL